MSNPALHLVIHTTPPTNPLTVIERVEELLNVMIEDGQILDYWPGATESGDPGGWRWSLELDRELIDAD